MIAEDPATWTTLVNRLHDAAVPALKATDAKNAKGLFDAGEHIEHACEACHQQYWYPPKEAAAWKKSLAGDRRLQSLRAVPTGKGGTITGHVAVKGKVPGNPVIRMGMDPMCATAQCRKAPGSGGRGRHRRRQPGQRLREPAGIVSRRAGSRGAGDDRSTRAACTCLEWSARGSDRRFRCETATSCFTTCTASRRTATPSTSASPRPASCRSFV